MSTIERHGLTKLREPFPSDQISKLPKPTKAQTDAIKADYKVGVRCGICGTWHHPKVVHLDYVGHAALTNRLLDCDPEWNWRPVAVTIENQPLFDKNGGLWIHLTVCGITRLGYGHAGDKTGGDAIKEIIGDALRNAAMRFGAALDLWHKGDSPLFSEEDSASEAEKLSQRTSVHTPTGGSWESQSVDMQLYLAEIAIAVKGWLDKGNVEAALDEIKAANLSAENKIALWTQFDSKQRSAMKRAEAEFKAAKSEVSA